jgi:hypothetical protein
MIRKAARARGAGAGSPCVSTELGLLRYQRTIIGVVNDARNLTPFRRSKIDPLHVHVVVIRSWMATGSSQCGQAPPGPIRWHGRAQSWHHCWPR